MEEFLQKFRNRTVAEHVGRLGNQTEASRRGSVVAADADNTSTAEHIARLHRDGKKHTSAELTKANDEWSKRAAAQKAGHEARFQGTN